jgi:malate permease and related proteins
MPHGLSLTGEFLSIASTVSGVFLVMAMGGFARYKKWFTSEVDRSMAGFTSNVLIPSLFFHRIMTDTKLSTNLEAWVPALFGFGLTALGLVFAALIVRAIGTRFGVINDSQRRTFSLCSGMANYGYIPIPLAEVFYPTCIVTLLVHNVGVDMALWSIGLFIISGTGIRNSWKRMVFSPPLLAVAIALTVRQLGIGHWIPNPILHMSDQLGRCSIPMGLVLSGAIIYDFAGQFKLSTCWKPLVLAVCVRLVALPILFLVVAKYVAPTRSLQEVLLLQAAMPAATFPIVLTRLYNQSVETAWTVVVGTSLIGLVSIPIWMVVGAKWLGL